VGAIAVVAVVVDSSENGKVQQQNRRQKLRPAVAIFSCLSLSSRTLWVEKQKQRPLVEGIYSYLVAQDGKDGHWGDQSKSGPSP